MSRYTGLIPDSAGLGGIPSAAMGGVDESLLPWLINVDVFMTPVSHTNWNTNTVAGTHVYNTRRDSSAAQNDEINYEVVLAAGTWTFELIYTKGGSQGIYSVQIDGAEVGTIDAYDASSSANNRTQITAIAVAATGKKTLKLKMATKNASSGGYQGLFNHLQLKRTA